MIRRPRLLRALIAFSLTCGLFPLHPAIGQTSDSTAPVLKSAGATLSTSSGPRSPAVDLTTAVMRVADRALPAVVHIDVVERQEIPNPLYGLVPLLPGFRLRGIPKTLERELRALGTGMIIDPEGHVLTNAHVVAGANKIEVTLATGVKLSAKVVGIDPKTDLAVIRIRDTNPLPTVAFADSDLVRVGQWVVAIGHPRGLDQTVTQGIISAKHRRGITDPATYQDFLQTDAAINPGNSGGPLLDLEGRVVGVNSMIASTSGGSQGLGFAIPSNMATHVADELIAHGKVQRGWLGIAAQDLTPALARALGLRSTSGAVIADVAANGPAHKAGLNRGDVVRTYQGEKVLDAADLRNRTAAAQVGDTVTLGLRRRGKPLEIQVRVGDPNIGSTPHEASVHSRLGIDVRPVRGQERVRYGLASGVGVGVTTVVPAGPLAQAGFEVGDLILEVDGQAVRGVAGMDKMVHDLKPGSEVVVLGVDHRSGRSGYVQIRIR